MSDYFNDSPIQSATEDRYEISPFANSLAKSIQGIKKPIGTTLALHGPWGSGKSSATNLIRAILEEAKGETLVISDFKCWWFRGQEALALAFLKNLDSILRDKLGDKVKDLVPTVGKGVLEAGSIIGPAVAFASTGPWGALAAGSTNFIKRFFPKDEALEKTFQKLEQALKEQNKRFLIIIDDIDRLEPEEALAIFRLVKTVGHLPNVMYLLIYDRALAEKVVNERYPSEGPHFLEKIIQAGFDVPTPLQEDINNAVLTSIEEVCGPIPEKLHTDIFNKFYDIVAPYITLPRHVVRFQNAISVTWPAVENEVNVADFIGLEAIRLYEPTLYELIRERKNDLIGESMDTDPDKMGDVRFEPYLEGISNNKKEVVKTALQRLFPRMEDVGYSSEFMEQWDAERRLCSKKHFDTYFRLSLGKDSLSTQIISDLIDRADDREFVIETMREAAKTTRSNGKTMIGVYLTELITHAKTVEKSKIENLLSALFEVHDEIDLKQDKDRGFAAYKDTTLRYHWLLRRLTLDRLTLGERTDVFNSAIENAPLGWLVDFVISAYGNYNGEKAPYAENECLVSEDAIPGLVETALTAIRNAATNGTLLDHQDLMFILYRWRTFSGNDPSEVKQWTDSLIENDKALVILAKAMTGESVSTSLGWHGLSDHTSTITPIANIESDMDILDVDKFKSQLQRIVNEAKLDTTSLQTVTTLLDAWDKKNAGDD